MAPIRKPVRSKIGESFQPVQLHRKKGPITKRQIRNQPQPLPMSRRVRGDCKRSQTRDKEEITQGVHQNKGNPTENWLGTVPLSLENLVDPFKQNTSDNMPQNSGLPSESGQISISMAQTGSGKTASAFGVRSPDFRNQLRKRNIFINVIDPSTELVKRAKEIFTDENRFLKMDDALAENLALKARKLETGTERQIVRQLVTPLIPAITEIPNQNLGMSEDKLWLRAVEVPLNRKSAITTTLSRPQPDFAFGYSEQAFNKSQIDTIELLVTQSHDQSQENYAIPDEEVFFPFLVVEAKAQSAGDTQFVASNQAANAGAVAMVGILDLARRISAEKEIDLDQPQFFSITIDHATAYINAHWFGRDAENGAFRLHMGHLQIYFLDVDGLKAVNLAAKNILHYGVNTRLAKIRGDLDTYSQKIKEKAIIGQGNLASDSLPEEQQRCGGAKAETANRNLTRSP